MNKIIFKPDQQFKGNLEGREVLVKYDENSQDFSFTLADGSTAHISDRVELEQRFGRFTEVEVLE